MLPLSKLTCFNRIDAVAPIAAGLSSQCYQVSADNKLFFTKQITSTRETTVSLHAASQHISPNVIFHDQSWLVTQYIDGENLALGQQSIDEKILIAIKLMVQCHQIAEKPIELAPKNITDELINNAHFSILQQTELLQVATQLTSELKNTPNNVCCHGDLNFSNIIIDRTKRAYLVDFECAFTAPAEYDLAMFVAVNNIDKDQVTPIINHYQKYSLIEVNPSLLKQYLLFCHFINGLWYMQVYNETNLPKFKHLANQQWRNVHLLKENISLW